MRLTIMPDELRHSTAAESGVHDRAAAKRTPVRGSSRARWRTSPLVTTLAVLWEKWKVVARRIGDFQARVLLSIFYFTVLAPFALGVKLFSDPLRLRATGGSGWTERPAPIDDDVTQARRQF